jgi:hypothetical protein
MFDPEFASILPYSFRPMPSARACRAFHWLFRLAAPLAAVIALLAPRDARAACYVAFVHGHQTTASISGNLEYYWNPDVTLSTPVGTENNRYSFTYWSALSKGCVVRRVTWNTTEHFRSRAPVVALALSTFITQNNIPDGNLIVVAHSMGGLVMRYILNNGVAGAPSFGASYERVKKATKYLITSQSPHTGSRAADAVANEDANPYVHFFADVASALGHAPRDNGLDSMRRIEMEYASAAGGWMGDAFRTRRIYTIDSHRVGATAGPVLPPGNEKTALLETAWTGLCYLASPLNLWLCPNVQGDGLVETNSAAGLLQRSGRWDGSRYAGVLQPTNYSSNPTSIVCNTITNTRCKTWLAGTAIRGARTRWLTYGGDHDQGRYDRFISDIFDYQRSVTTNTTLGWYIGQQGHALAL